MDEKHLPPTFYFKTYRIFDERLIENMQLRLYRLAIGWWCRNDTQVACAHQRKVQCTRDRCRCQCQRIHVRSESLALLLDLQPKLLRLINSHEPHVFELYILAYQTVCTDDDVNLTFFKLFQRIFYLLRGFETVDIINIDRQSF